MKTHLQAVKILIIVFLSVLPTVISGQANIQIYESYAILSINGGANSYYDMDAFTGNPDFQGANLGSYGTGSSLVVKGGQNETTKCNGGDVTGGNFYYRYYLTSSGPSGAFTPIGIGFNANLGTGCGGGDQVWEGTGGTENIISGLTIPGNYTLEVYSDATGFPGTVYSSNGGANYKATFTITKDFTWNGSSDTMWTNPFNWTPTGVPGASDHATVTGSGVANKLNIISDRSINNFTLAGTDATSFSLASGKTFTINGNFGYTGTASAILDCSSNLWVTNAGSQTIPPLTYGNLNILGGPRVLSPSAPIKICAKLTVDPALYAYTSAGSTVEYISSSTGQEILPFTYNNLTFSGTGNFSLGSSAPTGDKTINVTGNYVQSAGTVVLGDTASNTATLNIEGDMSLNGGTFDMNKVSGGKGTLNLKGALSLSNTALLNATSNTIANTNFSFVGTGDGLSPATTQTINVANQNTASNITFNVNSGAYTKLVNQNFALGTNSGFSVRTGGTLDFGFNGTTALNLIRVGSQIGQSFTSEAGSSLKISSPDGITKTANLGNVQVPVASRFFNEDATFYLIGKANAAQVALNGVDQVTGNAFPSSTSTLTSLKVIVDLCTTNVAQDDVSVKSLGKTKLNTAGSLTIRSGKVIDESGNGFEDASMENASLIMTGGRYTISRGGTQPSLGGPYSLTGGVIEFAGNSAVDIRTSKNFLNVEISGTNVSTGSATAGVTLLSGGKFTVKDNGVYKVANTSGFSGSTTTAVRSTNNPAIYLEPLSTIEYNAAGAQTISTIFPTSPADGHYQNLKISGTGVKTATGITTVKNTTNVDAAELLVASTLDNASPNEFYALKGITVNNALGAKFRLANNANLFQEVAAINVGDILTERNLNLSTARQQYNYVISPLINTNLKDIYKDGSGNAVSVPFVLYHNEANNKFYNSSGVYIPGRALALKEPTASAFSSAVMGASFSGVPKNGSFTFTLLNSNPTDPNRGNNLIGNPYPSNLDLIRFYTNNATNLDPTFKFWDNKANTETTQQGNGYSGNAYAQFNAALGTGTKAMGDAGTSSLKIPTQYVKIGQGFMARALVNNLTVTFDNSIRKAGVSESFFGKGKSDHTPVNRFWLSMISPQNIASQIAVVYLKGGNDGYTKEDSFSSDGSDALYSIVDDQKITINGKSAFTNTDVVSLGSAHFSTGNYTIVLDDQEGVFDQDQNIYLKDKQTGMVTNLRKGSYTFFANAGASTGRFEIIYKPETVLATDNAVKEDLVVYKDGSDFVVKAETKKITDLQVFDMNGRLIYSIKPNAVKVIVPAAQLVNGSYLLKIDQRGKLSTKKVIR
jgi:hypothetical protein